MSTTGSSAADQNEFTISVEDAPDGAVLRVHGEVDVYTSSGLREELYRLIDGGARRVTLDLSGMDFIDSSGLGVFVGALKRIREQSGELELRSPQPAARKVFDITGLTQVFTIVE
jgi:anti-sigma B factor antagonist